MKENCTENFSLPPPPPQSHWGYTFLKNLYHVQDSFQQVKVTDA